jgi:hypothetical protein
MVSPMDREFHVYIQPAAVEELDQAYLTTLNNNPQRFVIAPESKFVDFEIRQFNFGRRTGAFRVLFTIVDDTVHELHIRRAVRQQLTRDEIDGPEIAP